MISRFWDIQRQIVVWPWNLVWNGAIFSDLEQAFKVAENDAIQ